MEGSSTVARAAGLEGRIARVLRVGTYGAVTLIAIGVVALLAAGRSPLDIAPTLDPGRLLGDLVAMRPEAFLWLGLIAVLATPAARVAVSVVGFWRAGDRAMATVAILVLLVIMLGVVIGIAGPGPSSTAA
jgi:uncharacterized membrane protein